MKTEWDYTNLADAYLKRPDYADEAIQKMLKICKLKQDDKICDIGAGVGHLAFMLAKRGYEVYAVEPNDVMRSNGIIRTQEIDLEDSVFWYEGSGEDTGLDPNRFSLITFGSSFNVVDRLMTLQEVRRIAKKQAWFSCMWNHRDIDDPLQKEVENIIKLFLPDYGYGLRREDQSEFLKRSGYFSNLEFVEENIDHRVSITDWVSAWRSHATLQRQAADKFERIVNEIETYLKTSFKTETLIVPYKTKMWVGQLI